MKVGLVDVDVHVSSHFKEDLAWVAEKWLWIIRKWYVEFPLMCAGVLLLKTPANRYLSNKRPVYKLVTITSKT